MDGAETDVLGIQAEDGVEDDADGPGGDVGDHQGLDVLVDTDLTDASGQVGSPGQRRDVGSAEGPGDDHPGGQAWVDLQGCTDPNEGDPHGGDGGEGTPTRHPDQGADDEDGRQEELHGDDLETEVHDRRDRSGEDPGGNQHPDGEEDDQRVDPGAEPTPHPVHDGVPGETTQPSVDGQQGEGDEQRGLWFLLPNDDQVAQDTQDDDQDNQTFAKAEGRLGGLAIFLKETHFQLPPYFQ